MDDNDFFDLLYSVVESPIKCVGVIIILVVIAIILYNIL